MSRTIYRDSLAFKQKVISEIESGQITIAEARRIYDINGATTFNDWLQKFGKKTFGRKASKRQSKVFNKK